MAGSASRRVSTGTFSPFAFPYQQRDWVKVTVDFGFEYVKAYGEKVPVLTLREALPAKKPSQDPVYFT